MIVRLMHEGQYRVEERDLEGLNELDDQAIQAVEAGDQEKLQRLLTQMGDTVRERGQRLPDDELAVSDLVIPPLDLSLEEARELFSSEGLIPDLPAR
ncbi:MAG: hypothetical protein WBB74_05995 [Gaiellaceae bacterium]